MFPFDDVIMQWSYEEAQIGGLGKALGNHQVRISRVSFTDKNISGEGIDKQLEPQLSMEVIIHLCPNCV